MKSLYLIGTPGSGKTAVALGLALRLRQEGFNPGYFKPVGSTAGVLHPRDEDGVLMKTVLKMVEDLETIVPLTAGNFYVSGYGEPQECRDRVFAAYRLIAGRYGPVIIDGASFPWVMATFGLDAVSIAGEVGAGILCTMRIRNDFDFDEAVFYNRYVQCKGLDLVGNIFNNIPRPMLAKTQGEYANLLESSGFRWLGAIPHRREIHAPTVAEYHDVLGGELLVGGDRLELLVEDVLIGAMTIDSALDHLRRGLNKAVIIGGDRADYALAALETSTSVLILTGGLYPHLNVITRAKEKGVPVILVHYDTVTTVERLSAVARRIRPGDEKAIALARENIELYCDWQKIIELLEA